MKILFYLALTLIIFLNTHPPVIPVNAQPECTGYNASAGMEFDGSGGG